MVIRLLAPFVKLIKVFSLKAPNFMAKVHWEETAFHSSELLLELLSTSHRHFFQCDTWYDEPFHLPFYRIHFRWLPGVCFFPLLSNFKVVRKIKLHYQDEEECVLKFWNLCVSAWIPASVVQPFVLCLWIELNSHLNTFLNKLSILLLTPIPQIGSCYESQMTGRWENSWIPMSCRRVGHMFGLANIYCITLSYRSEQQLATIHIF